MPGTSGKLWRFLVRRTAAEQSAPSMDADGWTRQSMTRQEYPGPDPFRGLTESDPVFGWRREH